MADPIITLTTDFGDRAPYVAAVKGVILAINPLARILDLSHQIPAQDLQSAAFFLAAAIPYFPPEVIHLVVVDPGVGSERSLLYIEVGGHRLLAPDNGCWTELARRLAAAPRVIRLESSCYWRQDVSPTFHGRDILAPVAGWLSLRLAPELLGPVATEWSRLELPQPELGPNCLQGEVIFIDHFGNLLTNIPAAEFSAMVRSGARITVGTQDITRTVRTYSEAPPGTLVALTSSTGSLEIAVAQGNAAARLQTAVGAKGLREGVPTSEGMNIR